MSSVKQLSSRQDAGPDSCLIAAHSYHEVAALTSLSSCVVPIMQAVSERLSSMQITCLDMSLLVSVQQDDEIAAPASEVGHNRGVHGGGICFACFWHDGTQLQAPVCCQNVLHRRSCWWGKLACV